MVTIGARILLLIEILTYSLVGLSIAHHADVSPSIMIPVTIIIGICTIWFLLVYRTFIVANRFSDEESRQHRLGFFKRCKIIRREWWCELLLYKVLQSLSKWFDQPSRSSVGDETPVIFVHGLLCNGAAWWWMRRALAKRGIQRGYTINLEPIFGNIDAYAEQLQQRIEAVCNDTGASKVFLVAHSMGGLVSRSYIQNLSGGGRVAGLITLGTPHHGTGLAALPIGQNIIQMDLNSDWLLALNANETEPSPVPITSIYSVHDNIVSPQSSSKLICADNIPLSGIGHVALLFSPAVADLVAASIRQHV